jgi:hypothetical protein
MALAVHSAHRFFGFRFWAVSPRPDPLCTEPRR